MAETFLRGALVLIGAALCVMSAAGMVSPEWLVRVVRSVAKTRSGMLFAVIVRLVLGAILILVAPVSRFPVAFQIFGWVSIGAAVLLPLMGRQRMTALLDWFERRPPILIRGWLVFGLAFGAFLIFGVTGVTDPPAAAAEPEPAVFRGRVIHGHEVRSMLPCEQSEAVWVTDPSRELWSLLDELAVGEEIRREVFAVVRGELGPPRTEGFGADYPGELTVSEIVYVASEGFGCETDWNAFRYRAMGNEPFWGVIVSDGAVRLARMGEPEQVWSDVDARVTESGVSYSGAVAADVPAKLTLERAPCRDSMSGAFFGLSATVELGPETLTGCALTGGGS